jgi:UDP-N-acetyl-D-mannosaminuronate dehydrogenase
VGYVEAGLRTCNIYSPWPEEINRKVTGTIARLHFAPAEKSAANLVVEPNIESLPESLQGAELVPSIEDASQRYDIALLLVGHREFKFALKLLLDGKHVIDAGMSHMLARINFKLLPIW